jgi:phosphoglycolate phosphatase
MIDLTGRTVVFDLDGTLIDTAPDLIAAVNHVLESDGFEPVEHSRLRPVISLGGRCMIEAGLGIRGATYSPHQIDALFRRFIAYYSRNMSVHSRPFSGLEDELDRIAAWGAKIAVCTNKREDLARQLLDELGLVDRFAALAGRDTFPVCKPHPGHLISTIEKAGGEPMAAVMIGDSETDVKTAKAAGIPVIGVTFGYTDVPVTALDCDAVITAYQELPVALDGICGRSP